MKMTRVLVAVIVACAAFATPAAARKAPVDLSHEFCGGRYGPCYDAIAPAVHRPVSKSRRAHSTHQRAPRAGMVAVETALGPIAGGLDPSFAPKAQQVIADIAASGYVLPKGRRLGGYASGGHVRGSYHYRGQAVDVGQRCWGCSTVPKAVMRAAVARAGLRDGCEFNDHGHFDSGPHLPARVVRARCGAAYAAAIEPRRLAQARR